MAELPPDIEQLIGLARRAAEPSEVDQERVGRGLALALGLPQTGWTNTADVSTTSVAPGGAVGTQAAGAAATGVVLKTVALVTAIVATSGGALYLWHGDASQPGARVQPPVASHDPSRSSPRAVAPRAVDHAETSYPRPAPARDVYERATLIQPQHGALRAADAEDATSTQGQSRADSGAHTAPDSVRAMRTLTLQTAARESARAMPMRGSEAPAEPRPSGELHATHASRDELAELDDASRALERGEAQAALHALEAHRRRFGTGFLAEEREALWIIALCKVGRVSAAAHARVAFDRRAPRSPLRLRMDAECGSPDAR